MTEWYRRKSWRQDDQEEFFLKLSRARKTSRAQYLRVQAIELVETKNPNLLKIAESLLNKMLTDYPDDNFNKASAFKTLGDIYKLNGDFEKAIDFYKQTIDFELTYPQVQTGAYLDYCELIIKMSKTVFYMKVKTLLLEELPAQFFPVVKYKIYSILSVISRFENEPEQAEYYKNLANQNADAKTSGLRYHKYLGLVNEKDTVLDRLVNKKHTILDRLLRRKTK